MSKRIRQYVGLVSALIAYYVVHEGAHFLYALSKGVFKKINFMGLGVQIDIFRERLSDSELGVFCLVGAIATFVVAWLLVLLRKKICGLASPVLKAIAWYTSIIMLVLDPIYLSLVYRFVGGGDMNGIKLLIPETAAAILFGAIAIVHLFVLVRVLLPRYKEAFMDN